MTTQHPELKGLRVLVVEDESLIAMLIEDMLTEEGCTVCGPFGSVADALAASEDQQLDAAVLDVNVRGEKIYPVAERLAFRRVPFLLLTGYGADAIPRDRPQWRACSKPFTTTSLVTSLIDALKEKQCQGSALDPLGLAAPDPPT